MRVLLLAAALLALPLAAALPTPPLPSPCASTAMALDACVAWSIASDGRFGWGADVGGFVFTTQAEVDAWWARNEGGWPPQPAPVPELARGFAVVVAGWPTLFGDASVVEVASTGPGEYVVAFESTWVWGDLEFMHTPWEMVLVEPQAGAPARVTFVSAQTFPDGSPL